MFDILEKINKRPEPFEFYTTPELWNDEYISRQMLDFHLNDDVDLASRNKTFVNRSVNWIIKKLNIGTETKVCDFGCGPGLYTTPFAEAGAEVTGIDLSNNSITYAKRLAKEKDLSINYVLNNYLDFDTEVKFDVITMIFCDFSVLSPDQRVNLLNKFRKFLKPDGALLLDVSSDNFFNIAEPKQTYDRVQSDGFWSPDPYFVFENSFKYDDIKLFLSKFTIVEKNKFRESYNWLQCYNMDSLSKLLSENGFTIQQTFANVAGDNLKDDSNEICVIAKLSE